MDKFCLPRQVGDDFHLSSFSVEIVASVHEKFRHFLCATFKKTLWISQYIPIIFLRYLKLTIVVYYRFFKKNIHNIGTLLLLTYATMCVTYTTSACLFVIKCLFLSFRDKAMTKRDIRRLPRGAQVYVSMMCNDFSRRSIFSTRTTMAHTQWNFSLSWSELMETFQLKGSNELPERHQ